MGRRAVRRLLGRRAGRPHHRGPASRAGQSDQDKAVATTSSRTRRTLLAAGKVGEACRKLEESRRLDPLPGTVLNLAACHEREGLTASAMAEFREARAMAERDHRDDRVAFAEEHMKALEPRLSTLVIVVAPDADRPDLAVTRDGIALGRAAWGTRIPVDPGRPRPRGERRRARRRDASTSWSARDADVADGDAGAGSRRCAPRRCLRRAPPPAAVIGAAASAPPRRCTPPRGLSSRQDVGARLRGRGVLGVGAGHRPRLDAIAMHNDPNATCIAGSDAASDFAQQPGEVRRRRVDGELRGRSRRARRRHVPVARRLDAVSADIGRRRRARELLIRDRRCS